MELALVTLAALLVGVLLGVFFPQAGLVDDFTIQSRFGTATPILKALGLFNVYGASWFLGLQGLFFITVVTGSFRWLRPAYNSATLVTFLSASHIQRCAQPQPPVNWPYSHLQPLLTILKRHGYRVWPRKNNQGETQLYATKNAWGRLGPVVAHIGIVGVLVASFFGAFTRFEGQHLWPVGTPLKALSTAESFKTPLPLPWWQGQVPRWQVLPTAFQIHYDPKFPTVAEQYQSNLRILSEDGKTTLATGQTSVNHPFTYEGVTFYQSSYAPTNGLTLKLNGRFITINANKQLESRTYARLPINKTTALLVFPFYRAADNLPTDNIQVFLEKNGRLQGFSSVANTNIGTKNKPPHLYLAQGQSGSLAGQSLSYEGPVWATGLQFKKAPEAPWMALAVLLLCGGGLMSLFAQRQLWVALEVDEVAHTQTLWAYAKTKKAKAPFKKELAALWQELQALQPSPEAPPSC